MLSTLLLCALTLAAPQAPELPAEEAVEAPLPPLPEPVTVHGTWLGVQLGGGSFFGMHLRQTFGEHTYLVVDLGPRTALADTLYINLMTSAGVGFEFGQGRVRHGVVAKLGATVPTASYFETFAAVAWSMRPYGRLGRVAWPIQAGVGVFPYRVLPMSDGPSQVHGPWPMLFLRFGWETRLGRG